MKILRTSFFFFFIVVLHDEYEPLIKIYCLLASEAVALKSVNLWRLLNTPSIQWTRVHQRKMGFIMTFIDKTDTLTCSKNALYGTCTRGSINFIRYTTYATFTITKTYWQMKNGCNKKWCAHLSVPIDRNQNDWKMVNACFYVAIRHRWSV